MLRKSTTHVVLSRHLGVLLSQHRSLDAALLAAKDANKILAPHDEARVMPAVEFQKTAPEPAVDMKALRKWLQKSRGKQNEQGVSIWLAIAMESKVSIRTLTNICSGTYDVPRQKTLRGLEAVRKRMAK
jgi:hypothetical protein